MRRTLALVGIAALALSLLLAAGCSKKAETVTCAGCGMQVAKADARMIDGKPYCSHCAAKMQAQQQQTAMHKCPDCGMEMAEKDMVKIGDQWYCPNCAAKHQQGEHQESGGAGHDHG